MSSGDEYKSRETQVDRAFDIIRSADTSKYKSNPVVEMILIEQVEELKEETRKLREENKNKERENSELNVDVAVLREKRKAEKILEWMRNLIGVALGVSGALVFSSNPSTSKTGLILIPLFVVLFLFTCIFPLMRKEKHG